MVVMFASSWRSPVAGVRSFSRAICSTLSSRASAAVFSSTRETRFVPGIGAMSSPCASSQAKATCAGVASTSEATASTSSTMRRFFSKLPPVKRGLLLRQSSSPSSSGERIVPGEEAVRVADGSGWEGVYKILKDLVA